MTGERFESLFCELMARRGYWALKIPRDNRGAQPFDVIAIRGNEILALDCKVSGGNRFPLSRIEDNQWLSFWQIKKKTSAEVGIAVYYNGNVYYISYEKLLDAQKAGFASLVICDYDVLFSEKEITEEMRK